MVNELGHFALVAAFLVSALQAVVPLVGAQRGWIAWSRVAVPCAVIQFLLTALAFAALTSAFVTSDFSNSLVAANSHAAKPMIYKFTGVWGNHEGSMLLWVLILTAFGAAAALFGSDLPLGLRARVLAVQSLIACAFFAFILFSSNPFARLSIPPFHGSDLNPLLQDPGLAFHPPFLYLGYVGLSMSFSFAVAALIEGKVDAAWARWVRPWTLASWMFLTLGIALGSWWAYYELGWGGWWFWDPVENVSFIPWLIATALLHSATVVEKRESLKSWTVLLAILAFSFSLAGTFVVRSGILTSVHAFASDPTRGVFILAILGFFSGGALLLYSVRSATLLAKGVFGIASRESALILNNLLLVVAALVVFVGTFWPLVAELFFDRKLSVGPPFFEIAFTPFMVVLAAILPIGAIIPWKRGSIAAAANAQIGVLALSAAVGAFAWSLQTGSGMLAPIGFLLASWLILGSAADLIARATGGRFRFGRSTSRLAGLPGSIWGKFLAHSGLGLTILGITAVTAWQLEDIRSATPGDSFELGGYTFAFDDVSEIRGPNYLSLTGDFAVYSDNVQIAKLKPEKRFYPVAGMQTTEAAIDMGLTRDLYLVIGERQLDGGYSIRTYVKPFANWIWIGAIVMAAGALASLLDRRYRIGIAARRAARALPG
ncbi:MAG: heme lyase CcmF/NrfE family subunit [Albidovulum sp.]|nr:heme lyase CcmF/NrfE family subunit [Albidovulum sp.]MDE0305527.1 heme lyase CcmF/NrfE family subunit [Albidovulum sp.]MDE0533430.1 heme lyase CcmF/NrfE family subunit [Albidovulum sp.]